MWGICGRPGKHSGPCQVTGAWPSRGERLRASPLHASPLLGSETPSASLSACLRLPNFRVCARAHFKDSRASGSLGWPGGSPNLTPPSHLIPLGSINGAGAQGSEGRRRGTGKGPGRDRDSGSNCHPSLLGMSFPIILARKTFLYTQTKHNFPFLVFK